MEIEFVVPPSPCQVPLIIWITLPGVFSSPQHLINYLLQYTFRTLLKGTFGPPFVNKLSITEISI